MLKLSLNEAFYPPIAVQYRSLHLVSLGNITI